MRFHFSKERSLALSPPRYDGASPKVSTQRLQGTVVHENAAAPEELHVEIVGDLTILTLCRFEPKFKESVKLHADVIISIVWLSEMTYIVGLV